MIERLVDAFVARWDNHRADPFDINAAGDCDKCIGIMHAAFRAVVGRDVNVANDFDWRLWARAYSLGNARVARPHY